MTPTILAIDDETLYLKLIHLFLTNAGYNVITIEGGRTGMDYLTQASTTIDAILLDLMMPDLHGLDILHFIRNHARLGTVPVILQTATPNEEEIDQGFRLGASACIRKPYTVTELLNVLSGFPSLRKPAAAGE